MSRSMVFKASVPIGSISVEEWRARRAAWRPTHPKPEVEFDPSDLTYEPCRREKCVREGAHPAHDDDPDAERRGRPIAGTAPLGRRPRDRTKAGLLARRTKGLYDTVRTDEAGAVVRCSIAGCVDCDGTEMSLRFWTYRHSAVKR